MIDHTELGCAGEIGVGEEQVGSCPSSSVTRFTGSDPDHDLAAVAVEPVESDLVDAGIRTR